MADEGEETRSSLTSVAHTARSRVILALLLSTAVSARSSFGQDENAGRTVAPHENLATAAEQLLRAVRETHYEHRTHVDAASGVYDVDCSGLVDYLVKRVAPTQFAQLPVETGHTRPRAKVYYRFFQALRQNPLPGWESVPFLDDARRGDILAWERVTLLTAKGDTGHVAIVAAPPTRQADGTFRVEVYDSSMHPHDADSRTEGTTGVGKGVIVISVNSRGEPKAVRWNSNRQFHQEPIAISRLVE